MKVPIPPGLIKEQVIIGDDWKKASTTLLETINSLSEASRGAFTSGLTVKDNLKAEFKTFTVSPWNPWIPLPFYSSWTDYDINLYGPAGYRKDSAGHVRFRGVVKPGASGPGNPIACLPVQYRPQYDILYSAVSEITGAEHPVYVKIAAATGFITEPGSHTLTWLSLAGPKFEPLDQTFPASQGPWPIVLKTTIGGKAKGVFIVDAHCTGGGVHGQPLGIDWISDSASVTIRRIGGLPFSERSSVTVLILGE